MRLLKVKSVKEGILLFLNEMNCLQVKEVIEVPLDKSLGFILAQKIVAREDLPPFSKSTVDGFAVMSSSTVGATQSIPTLLRIIEDIEMGEVPKLEITPGVASRILTGGMLPPGADAVVMVEDTEVIAGDQLALYRPLRHLENVNALGEDCKKGDLFFAEGKRITSKVIASCASLGYGKIKVYRRLRTSLLSTGDEILPPDVQIPLGKTRDINSFSIEALSTELGLEVVDKKHIKDSKEELREAIARKDIDLLLVSGSSSQGEKDYLAELIDEHDPGLLFHGLAIKPGKPTILGSDGKKIILGLPGHPVSAMIVFKIFFEEAWKKLYGVQESEFIEAILSQNVPSSLGRRKIQLVRLESKEGEKLARPIFGASGNISTLAKADGYLVLEEEEEGVRAGEKVRVFLLP